MASAGKKVAKAVPFSASDLASIKDNPYIRRVIEDGALRDNVTNVIESSKGAYERLVSNGAPPHKAVLEDNKLHGHVQSAAGSLRDIALALNDVDTKHNQPFKKKKHRGRSLLLLLVIGTGVALVLSEGLRNKLLDALFGKEEEFQYTPPAPAPTEPPASPVSAA